MIAMGVSAQVAPKSVDAPDDQSATAAQVGQAGGPLGVILLGSAGIVGLTFRQPTPSEHVALQHWALAMQPSMGLPQNGLFDTPSTTRSEPFRSKTVVSSPCSIHVVETPEAL